MFRNTGTDGDDGFDPSGLINYAAKFGIVSFDDDDSAANAEDAVVALIQIIVATQEYQTV